MSDAVGSDILKFGLLGLPAGVILIVWRRSGVLDKTWHALSWANLLGYVCWLLTLIAVAHTSTGPSHQWLVNAETGVLIFGPLAGVLLSALLLIAVVFADKTQRVKFAACNGFMFVLWLASVIAPN